MYSGADMAKFFDEISHTWLVDHIPMDRRILVQWLKAGFMENQRLFPTLAGTPPGGIALPVLDNFRFAPCGWENPFRLLFRLL